MSTLISPEKPSLKSSAWVMLFLWALYTLVYTLPFDNNLEAILEALVGVLGIVILLAIGVTRQDLYLQVQNDRTVV
jgi:hypothetical protein